VLEHPKSSTPSIRVTITEMRSQRPDRGRDELFERLGPCLGLGRLTWPSAEVSACASCVLELYW
jgi:hypothetical protein